MFLSYTLYNSLYRLNKNNGTKYILSSFRPCNYRKPGNRENGKIQHGSTINVNPVSPGIYNIFI